MVKGISVEIQDVFNTKDPREDHFLGRAANFLHITTRTDLVKRAILFKPGETVDARLIHESERLLRDFDWIRDASIVPARVEGGGVWAMVRVHDAWSIKGGIRFSHVGGESAWRLRLHEVNLLGRGKSLLVSHEKDLERTTDELAYGDPMLFGSRWTLNASYAKLSDGTSRTFALQRPYFALHSGWSVGAEAATVESNLNLYDGGHKTYVAPSKNDVVRLFASHQVASSSAWSLRLGLEAVADQTRYGRPVTLRPSPLGIPTLEDRRLRGAFAVLGFVQDRFLAMENLESVARVEDVNLGWDMEIKAGAFLKSLGADRNAPAWDWRASKATHAGEEGLFVFRTEGHGRRESTGFRDVLSSVSLTYYNQHFRAQTLAAHVETDWGQRPDPERVLYLGGSDGLRGYPNHYIRGDRRWLASFEDRVVTNRSLWGLVQVGYVAFADAGAIRREGSGGWSRTYADAGAGLRFGNLKSAFGKVLLLTVAVPLVRGPGVDNYQIVVGNVIRF